MIVVVVVVLVLVVVQVVVVVAAVVVGSSKKSMFHNSMPILTSLSPFLLSSRPPFPPTNLTNYQPTYLYASMHAQVDHSANHKRRIYRRQLCVVALDEVAAQIGAQANKPLNIGVVNCWRWNALKKNITIVINKEKSATKHHTSKPLLGGKHETRIHSVFNLY